MIFGYTKFLESQVEHLQSRIEALEARNQELVITLVGNKFNPAPAKTAEPTHKMSKGETLAKCSCGWTVMNTDPVVLQEEITKHYRNNVASGSRRIGWGQARQRLEEQAEKEVTHGSS